MSELLATTVRWIWKKMILLILIVLMLLVANWFRSEWKEISAQLNQASELDAQIKRTKLELNELAKQSAGFGEEAQKEFEKLNSAEKVTAAAWAEAMQAKEDYDAASSKVGWYQNLFDHEKVETKGKAWLEYETKLKAAEVIQKTTDALRAAQQNSPWADNQKLIAANQSEIGLLEARRVELLDSAGKTPTQRLVIATRNVLPLALWALLGIILTPIAIKAFLYFGVAPLISRTKPVVVLPSCGAEVQSSPSAISIPVTLNPGDELIVHSQYLQASGAGPGKSTRWIFSWRMPLTSVAAGLYMMVSVRNRSHKQAKVTVSPKQDLFDMISDVIIPEGSAMVIYPRSLVGIVIKQGKTPRITRHWKLWSLYSWITFQFRYIVIHGDSRILMKGCRGVRAERVESTKPAMQDQLSTLGFTANLSYSAIRCETFLDYLLGRDELFNDKFSDAEGFHFTEEVPNHKRKAGLFGRGLEGVLDGLLKAFGI